MDYRIWLAFAVGMLIGASIGSIFMFMMHTAAMRIIFVSTPVSRGDEELIKSWTDWAKQKNNMRENHG